MQQLLGERSTSCTAPLGVVQAKPSTEYNSAVCTPVRMRALQLSKSSLIASLTSNVVAAS